MNDSRTKILILVEGAKTDVRLMQKLLTIYNFDQVYSDILLIFDLDPQDPSFTPQKIQRMMDYFVESSDMGKLYLNYPMVEAFYHMQDISDAHYNAYFAQKSELVEGIYKKRVNQENRNGDYRKFAVTREECSSVIQQNLEKARWLCSVQDFTHRWTSYSFRRA